MLSCLFREQTGNIMRPMSGMCARRFVADTGHAFQILEENRDVRIMSGDFWLVQTPTLHFPPRPPVGWWVGHVWQEFVCGGSLPFPSLTSFPLTPSPRSSQIHKTTTNCCSRIAVFTNPTIQFPPKPPIGWWVQIVRLGLVNV